MKVDPDWSLCPICNEKVHVTNRVMTTEGYVCANCYFNKPSQTAPAITPVRPTEGESEYHKISSHYLRNLPYSVFEGTLTKHVLTLDDQFLKARLISEGMTLADTDCIGSCSCDDPTDPDVVFIGRGDGTILGWHAAADGVREEHGMHLSRQMVEHLRSRNQAVVRKAMEDADTISEKAALLSDTESFRRISNAVLRNAVLPQDPDGRSKPKAPW